MSNQKIMEKLKDDPLMPIRHTTEHVLQFALKLLHPDIKEAMGPAIEEGFYFDFDLDKSISQEDFGQIEAKMAEIIKADLPVTKKELNYAEAKNIFKENPYKLELIEEIQSKNETFTLYEFGSSGDELHYLDLCAGPHAKSTGEIKAFKLLNIAGAYWRGDEKNKMLQRIYGTTFNSQEELDEYLALLEEAKKRDHRKLGKELDLFTFAEEVGGGLPLWTPKGTVIREELENWAKETEKAWGYVRVATPHIGKHTLYETSGHLPYYKDDMYPAMNIDGEDFYLKGMNCPHHHMIFKSTPKSYRDLPLRFAEYGTVYRYEKTGSLFGLMRVRSIAQNDAHIYCTLEQAEKEFLDVIKLHEYYYNALGLSKEDYYIVIGLPDEKKRDKYHGDKELWDKAEQMMKKAIEHSGIRTVDDIGGAAFYGPKIDFNIKSSIGREFSISTNQLDLYMPTRFNLEFTNSSGEKELAAVIHRAPLGSHERFIGFLIEHFGGAFPVWLSPVQVKVIPISETNLGYALQIKSELEKANLRVEVNDKNETMQAKIRAAQLEKVPYMLIVGRREEENGQVSVRLRDERDLGSTSLDDFITRANEIRLTKSLNLW